MEETGEIGERLLAWFATARRDLPWRRGYDPYQVWISEVMLQQTRMDRVVPFFLRWLARFPDAAAVAAADPDELAAAWEGLGYYSRVRALQRCARELVERHSGRLPESHGAMMALPGIGPYTAAAIMSIAFNHDLPVVDGNVKRVLARLDDLAAPLGSKELEAHCLRRAGELLVAGRAREFNQAMMELGATICLPQRPGCDACPLAEFCRARRNDRVPLRPVKGKRTPIVPRFRVAALLLDDDQVLVRRRPPGGRWGGLWELPDREIASEEDPGRAVKKMLRLETGIAARVEQELETVVSGFTHHRLTTRGFLCSPVGKAFEGTAQNGWQWVPRSEALGLAYAAAHRKIIDQLGKRWNRD